MTRERTAEERKVIFDNATEMGLHAVRGYLAAIGMPVTDVYIIAAVCWRYQSGAAEGNITYASRGCPNCISTHVAQHVINVAADSMTKMKMMPHEGDHAARDA